MGILSGIFKARDKPTNATAGSAYRFLFGGSTSGKAVTERSAMQMTAVYSCVRMVADALAGKIDLIVTKSVSRFARNTVDSLTTIRQLKEKGIEVYFEKKISGPSMARANCS